MTESLSGCRHDVFLKKTIMREMNYFLSHIMMQIFVVKYHLYSQLSVVSPHATWRCSGQKKPQWCSPLSRLCVSCSANVFLCVSAPPSSWHHDQTLSLSAGPLHSAAVWGLGQAGLPADRLLSWGSRGELGGGWHGGDGGGPDQLRGREGRTLQQQQHPDPEPTALDGRRSVHLQGPASQPQPDPDTPQEPVSGLEGLVKGQDRGSVWGEQEERTLCSHLHDFYCL